MRKMCIIRRGYSNHRTDNQLTVKTHNYGSQRPTKRQPSNYLTIKPSNLLYRLAIAAYHLGIRIAAWFSPKARAWVDGRRYWETELRVWRERQPENARIIWMHCASLGEFEQGRPVLERLREERPDSRVVLTFYSPSGYEQQRNYSHADYIAYLPADGPRRADKWVTLLQPHLVLFVKYEFWAYYLRALFRKEIHTVLIGGTFRPQQIFFRWYGGFFLRLLQGFDHLFVQRAQDAELLRAHGIHQVTIAGDPRVDRVLTIAKGAIDFPLISAFKAGERLFIGGSTWPPGEQLLLSDQTRWQQGWKLLLAPHDIGAAHLQRIEAQLQLPYCRYSQQPTTADLRAARVLILDTIGMLSRVYHYGELAYIGGGFGASIHNTLEPAAHGLPIFIGPKHHKFQEALTLIAEGGAFEINNEEEFQLCFDALQNDPEMERARAAVSAFLRTNTGATERILRGLANGGP